MTSIDGVVSGLDTTSLINAIVESQSVRLRSLQSQENDWRDRQSTVSDLNSRLSSLSETLQELGAPESLSLYSTDLSDESQFSVSFGSGTQPGTYSVQVLQTATLSSWVGADGFSARDQAGLLSSGTFDVSVGGTTTQVSIDATDTLDTLAAKLDALEGVTSYVVDTGSGTNPYKLVVAGTDTGLDNAVDITNLAFDGSATDLTFADPAVEGSIAQDAQISVNGLVLSSADNAFHGQIPGIDIDARSAGTSPIVFTVERDDDAIAEKLEAFVTAYNDIKSFYDVNTVYNTDVGLRGPLVGDSSARRIMDQLSNRISENYLGDSSAGYFGTSLSRLGILTTREGTLEFDRDTLDTVLTDNPDLVQSIFSTDGVHSQVYSDPSDAFGASGTLKITGGGRIVEGVTINPGDTLSDVAAQLNGLAGIEARVLQDGNHYRLFMTSTDSADGAFEVEVTSGDLGNALLFDPPNPDGVVPPTGGPLANIVRDIEDLFIGEDGLLDVRSETIESQISDLQNQIERQQNRIDSEVERLRARFSNLEVTLGQLNSTQAQLGAILGAASLF